MDTLHVRRLRARYRLPAGEGDARARLDRVLREAVGGALEHALARAGVDPREEVCLRTVSAPARLRLHEPDSALADAWGGALAEAIRATLAAGGPGVVRYSSRAHAVVDLLLGVARGDLRRAWAWRQVGLWRAGDTPSTDRAAEEAARVLVSHPEHAVAALAEAARAGVFPALAARIRPEAWAAVVRAALAAASVSPAAADALVARIGAEPSAVAVISDADRVSPSTSPAAIRATERITRASAIARVVSFLSTIEGRIRLALAVVAALEVDPAALRRTLDESRAIVDGVEREMEAAASAAALDRPREADRREGDRRAGRRRDAASAEDDRRPDAIEPADGDAPPPAESVGDETRTAMERTASPEDEERPVREVRRSGATRWGGLLFLFHVLDALGVPDEVVADETLAARPLRWTLHRLALELLALDERDPAALAFAGLGPDRDPPSRGEPAATEEESARIADLARRVSDALHLRVRGEEPASARASAALLREVCRRDATIDADPGWIDVRLALDEVSVDARRAGLDLDPGWVPWLGCVVRFVYG